MGEMITDRSRVHADVNPVVQACSELRVGRIKPKQVAGKLKELHERATMYQEVEELRTKLLSKSSKSSSPRLFSALLEGTHWTRLSRTVRYEDSCSHGLEAYLSVTDHQVSVVVHSIATGLPLYLDFRSHITGVDDGADADEEDYTCLYISRTLFLFM
jgi:hypothetical protein